MTTFNSVFTPVSGNVFLDNDNVIKKNIGSLNMEDKVDFDFTVKRSDSGYQNILVAWTSKYPLDSIKIEVKGMQNETIRSYNIKKKTKGEQLVKVYYGTPVLYILSKYGDETYERTEMFSIPAKILLASSGSMA